MCGHGSVAVTLLNGCCVIHAMALHRRSSKDVNGDGARGAHAECGERESLCCSDHILSEEILTLEFQNGYKGCCLLRTAWPVLARSNGQRGGGVSTLLERCLTRRRVFYPEDVLKMWVLDWI